MTDDHVRVHVAGEPRPTEESERRGGRRIVQPCARCGIVLGEFDMDNPPMVQVVEGESPQSLPWYGVGDQYGRDPGYPDAGMTMTFLVSDEEIAADGLALCDAAEVPDSVETFS